MVKDKIERLIEPLKYLKENTAFLETAAIINSQDGLIIASTCASEIEEQNIAAITATAYSKTVSMVSLLKKGILKQLILETEKGYIVICVINSDTLLAILAGNNANLGLIFFNIKKTLKKLIEIL